MSRYSLKPLPEHADLFEIAVGWDAGLDTYFIMVFGTPDVAREPGVRLWRGTTFQEITSTAMLLAIAKEFAEIPDGLAASLHLDHLSAPHNPERPISKLMADILARGSSSRS